jgi:oxygen-independent coproporphyrinogen-3 oxidase
LQALHNERAWLADQLGRKRSLRQLHFGCDTLNSLSFAQLQWLWQSITENFELAPDAELAIAVHPGVTEWGQLERLVFVSSRYLSLGVQNLNLKVQQAINRFQTTKQTWKTVRQS